MLIRVFDGMVKPGMTIRLMSNNRTFDVTEVGIFSPKRTRTAELKTGDVGYVVAG